MGRHKHGSRETIDRRRFCQLAGTSACAMATGGAGALVADFLRPRALFEPPTQFAIAPPETFQPGAVLTEEKHRVLVMRLADGFRALSTVCTHLGCITRYQPDEKLIACPCHGSRFDLDGEVLAGPAPRPLRWLRMGLSARGLVTVDAAAEVPLGTVYKL